MSGGNGKGHRETLLFKICLTVSLSAIGYSVAVTTIDGGLDFRVLPILWVMPATFWVGLGSLMLATIVWGISKETSRLHLLLFPLWLLYVFVGPELMQPNPRGVDLHLGMTPFYLDTEEGRNQIYGTFPGFFLFFRMIEGITGIDYIPLSKFAAQYLHLMRGIAILYLGWHLLKGEGGKQRPLLLFGLLTISMHWLPLEFDPAPQYLVFILYLFLLRFLLSHPLLDWREPLLMALIFSATVMIHPITPLVVSLMLVLLLTTMPAARRVVPLKSSEVRAVAFNASPTFIALFVTIYIAYFLYSADWHVAAAIKRLQEFFATPTHGLSWYTVVSPYRTFIFRMTYLFYIILLVWFLICISRKGFWASFGKSRVLYLWLVIPTFVQLIGIYSLTGTDRVFLLGGPLVALFLTCHSWRKKAVVALLVLLLPLSFGIRYAQEFEYNLPSTEFAGARFVSDRLPLESTVFVGLRWSPSPQSMAYSPHQLQPHQADVSYLAGGWKPGTEGIKRRIQYGSYGKRGETLVKFHKGEELWEIASYWMYVGRKNTVYANGSFEVYTYPPVREPADGP